MDPRNYRKAASIAGAAQFGVPVRPDAMPAIDLISAGSVAVRTNGARIGKGGGYSDLEFAIGTQLGLISESTVIFTTVHDEQVVKDTWNIQPYDIPLNWVFTPTRSIECKHPHPRPTGILWDQLDPSMRDSIPILDKLV